MSISFTCPHCQFAYSRLKDELAGKRATCKNPDCRKVIVIPPPPPMPTIAELGGIAPTPAGKDHTPPPKAPVDIEAAAMSALADAPKEQAAAAAETVPVTCDYCAHQWAEPIDKAGKNVLCPNPECRQRVKVPVPQDKKHDDWRGAANKPSLAKENVEKPKDVIDAEAKYVSGQAWTQGGGAEQELEPIPLGRQIRFWTLVLLPVVGVLVGGVYLWNTTRDRGDDRLMADAVKQLDPKELPPTQGPLYSALLHTFAGEYELHKEQPKSDKALEQFTIARNDLRQAAQKDDAKKTAAGERNVITCELAVATLGLGGDGDRVANEERIRWVPESNLRALRANEKRYDVHTELQRTLDLLRGADFDLKDGLARRLTRELVARDQVGLAADIPVMLFTEPEQPEAKAVVALEIYRAKKADEKVRAMAGELQKDLAKGAGNKNPVPGSAQVLWQLLEIKAPAIVTPPQGGSQQVPDPTRLAYVGLYLLKDEPEPEKALDLARRPGGLAGQLRALLLYAEWAKDPAPAFDTALSLIDQTKGKKDAPALPPYVVLRLARLAAVAGKAEQAAHLADALPDEGLKAWAKADARRLLAARDANTKMEDAGAPVPEDAKNLRAGHAWGQFWVARHNTRVSGSRSKETKEIGPWPKGTVQPFGLAGIALGLKDR
jgi:hypothetical protein